ncbi:hypothetical protein D3C75_1204880 [compost metagenome]
MRVSPTLKISSNGVANVVRNSGNDSTVSVSGATFLGLRNKCFSIISTPAVLTAGAAYDFDLEADAEL